MVVVHALPGFELPITTAFAQWSVVAVLNYTHAMVDRTVALSRLRVPAVTGCVAFEFWDERLVGEFEGELKVRVGPQSVALLSVHPRTVFPCPISTDRHFTQGAVELSSVIWDDASNTLRGTSLGPPGTAHNVSIYVPHGYRLAAMRPEYFEERGAYSVQPVGSNILRVRARFDDAASTDWEVKFLRE